MRLLRFIFYHLEEIILILLIPLALVIGLSTYIYFNGEQEKAEEIRKHQILVEAVNRNPSRFYQAETVEELEKYGKTLENRNPLYRRKDVIFVLERYENGDVKSMIYKTEDFIVID